VVRAEFHQNSFTTLRTVLIANEQRKRRTDGQTDS